MDSAPHDLLPTALFSPSKAALQRAQAQEWHQVDSWLSAKYQGRSVPQFERNEDTLKILMALSAANEKADEERELLWAVQKEGLSEIQAQKSSNTSLLAPLELGLDARGKVALDGAADVAVKLGTANVQPLTIASRLCEHTQMSQTLEQQILHLNQLLKVLDSELFSLRAQMQELRSPAFQAPLSLQRQTMEWNRNTKHLRAKLNEYTDRLAVLQANTTDASPASVHALVAKEEAIANLEDEIALLAAKIDAYQGLPKDKTAALQQVKAAESEVSRLKQQLDAFFEGLVDKS